MYATDGGLTNRCVVIFFLLSMDVGRVLETNVSSAIRAPQPDNKKPPEIIERLFTFNIWTK